MLRLVPCGGSLAPVRNNLRLIPCLRRGDPLVLIPALHLTHTIK